MWIFKFLHQYQPSPIILQVGPISIHWYGLIIVIGILAAYYIISFLSKKSDLQDRSDFNILDILWDMGFYLIIFGLLGARLYHILSELPYYLKNPLDMFMIWQGGLGIFGAILAGSIVIFIYTKKYKLSFLILADLLAPGLILAQAIGRWGNYFNSELFGQPTNLPWGIPISALSRPSEFLSYEYFHPTFLYESLWNLFVFAILLFIIFKIKNHKGRNIIGSGKVFGFYLALYAFGRFIIEFLRIDSQPIIFELRLAQIVAIVVFIVGVAIIIWPRQAPRFFARLRGVGF